MSKDDIAGYACPNCGTASAVSIKYCPNCGHWLLDTLRDPIPLSKKEFRERTKNVVNPFHLIANGQTVAGFALIFGIFINSQSLFNWVMVAYFIWLIAVNRSAGKVWARQQKDAAATNEIRGQDARSIGVSNNSCG
jgi:predicted RNA-binding Zn-ribbon protein involved in translation (DUF1610 family)